MNRTSPAPSRLARAPRPVRYLLAGVLNTAFGYGLFALCYLGLSSHWPYAAILVLSHLLAVSFSFTTHRHLVFNSPAKQPATATPAAALAKAWLRYQLSYLGLLLLGLAVNAAVLRWVLDSPWLAQLIATFVGVLAGYGVHRYFVFKADHD